MTFDVEIDGERARLLYRLASLKTFRGEIYDHNKEVPLGKGYANNNEPFDIDSACYLKPVFKSARASSTRKLVARSAVQTLKTLMLEKIAAYLAEVEPGDMAIYDCDIEAADDHAKSRLGPFLKNMPGLAAQIGQAESANRFDVTTTELYLPGMTLRIWPLNESSTQRFTLRYVLISDGFLSKRTGMIKQAIARATQHPHDKKIIIESQGSDAGDDFDIEWQTTNQGLLNVVCPYCDTNQPFEWERERPSDFVPTEPKRTCEGKAPKAGTFSGMIRGDASADREKGEINAPLVLANTHYECYHCGALWRDVPEIRKQLDQSSNYIAQNPMALPENVGFSWPFWINQRLRWGADDYGMLAYLLAKKIDRETGNRDPFKQWIQKRAGKTWTENTGKARARVIVRTSDTENVVENEACRIMKVDCQQDPNATAAAGGQSMIGHFWYTAWAVDASGKVIAQLARGYADSWANWIAVQKRLKIPAKNVAIDGGNWRNEVIEAAAKNWEVGYYIERGKKKPCRVTWTVMVGSAKFTYRKHKDGVYRPFTEPSFYPVMVEIDGKFQRLTVPVLEWSNLAVKDILHAIRMGGSDKPKIHVLPREKLDALTQKMESGPRTYEEQIRNEYRTMEKGKNIWKEHNPNVHYNDCDCMGIVQLMRAGVLGIPAVSDEEVSEA